MLNPRPFVTNVIGGGHIVAQVDPAARTIRMFRAPNLRQANFVAQSWTARVYVPWGGEVRRYG